LIQDVDGCLCHAGQASARAGSAENPLDQARRVR
jgi:hypothetical protein